MTTCLGISCSFGLPRVSLVYCCQFMYLVVSLLDLRAGCGIWLYQFLIIAYRFTFHAMKEWKWVQMAYVTWPRWSPCPYMLTNFRIFLLLKRKADEFETWYAALSTRVLPSLFKWYHWVDNDLFYDKVKFGPLCFCMEKKIKQWIFPKLLRPIVAIKFGWCSQLNEYMKLYEYQRSRTFIDLGPNHSDFSTFNFLFLSDCWFYHILSA